jgi:uncharacterized membrane-anchored protein YhcB (DUF1043 family)
MIEEQLIKLVGSNAIGVFFGVLMYRMANNSIKEQTNAIKELIIEIKACKRKK